MKAIVSLSFTVNSAVYRIKRRDLVDRRSLQHAGKDGSLQNDRQGRCWRESPRRRLGITPQHLAAFILDLDENADADLALEQLQALNDQIYLLPEEIGRDDLRKFLGVRNGQVQVVQRTEDGDFVLTWDGSPFPPDYLIDVSALIERGREIVALA